MSEMKTEILSADADGLERAAGFVAEGRLVAFPTETVYGLGADATSDKAVAEVFAAKGRPSFNPLIVHVPDLVAAARIAAFTPLAERAAAAFWPGPLTLVLPLSPDAGISALVTAGLGSIALRVPDHGLAARLLAAFGGPVAAPSANPSGRISPTTADHVAQGLDGKIAAILDGGPTSVGLESSILDLTGTPPRLLREGGVPVEALERVLGPIQQGATTDAHPKAPGQLASHYAPAAAVRLDVMGKTDGEVLLGFGDVPEADLNLSARGDLTEAAANLFGHLHRLDAMARPIAVSPVPDHGLGRAINDRLRRAAAPRAAG
ncbi:MAG: L-threonylcarbamoyladenylate synthase [Pseudomonadota bacterium]